MLLRTRLALQLKMVVEIISYLFNQTYFLSNLRQDQLSKALFPVGHLTKFQVRDFARKMNLPTQVSNAILIINTSLKFITEIELQIRKDSQGICFLGKLKFEDFIGHYLGDNPGEIRCYTTNELLGHHKGLWYHTIGQRKGLGLRLLPKTVHKGPYFVAGKDMSTNTLFITNKIEV